MNKNGYFNYHGKIRKLISENHLINAEIVDQYNGIAPAMLLRFNDGKIYPVREHRFLEYAKVLENIVDSRTKR